MKILARQLTLDLYNCSQKRLADVMQIQYKEYKERIRALWKKDCIAVLLGMAAICNSKCLQIPGPKLYGTGKTHRVFEAY